MARHIHPVHKFLRENSLSIVLFLLFVVFLAGQAISGYYANNEELASHNQAAEPLSQYLQSGGFVESVFENWESEFLQMGALVVLTIWLRQKGSADSKQLRGKAAVDTQSRYSIIHAHTAQLRAKAIKRWFVSNSLSLVLFGLFALSFVLHAFGGVADYNQEAKLHHEPTLTLAAFMASPQFWFQSFQNWQSEFLSVAALLVLSIYLRQRGSPESKAVGEPNSKTGE